MSFVEFKLKLAEHVFTLILFIDNIKHIHSKPKGGVFNSNYTVKK